MINTKKEIKESKINTFKLHYIFWQKRKMHAYIDGSKE